MVLSPLSLCPTGEGQRQPRSPESWDHLFKPRKEGGRFCLAERLRAALRMLTVTKALEEALLQHFIYQKLDIAYAINKPFPFFEALRDNSFITEKMYKESLEACQNLVPLSRVVHSVLTKLEKTFSLSLLMALFSRVNLREYPDLEAVSKSFQKVGAAYGGWSRTTPVLHKAPAHPAEGSSLQTLLPLAPPQPPPSSHLSCASGVSDTRASSLQILEILDEGPHPSDPDRPRPGFTQEGRSTPVTRDNLTSAAVEEEDSAELPRWALGNGHSHTGTRDDSEEPNDPEGPQAEPRTPANKKAKKRKRCIWSVPKRRHQKKCHPQESALPMHGAEEKLKEVDSGPTDEGSPRKDHSTRTLKVVRSTQKTRAQRAQASRSGEISDETSEMNSGKRSQKTLNTTARIMPSKN